MAYDALGLIYYVWKKNKGNVSINNFFIKEGIKGKIGKFKLENNEILQELKIYKTQNKSFKEF